jgi:hypothetical protein
LDPDYFYLSQVWHSQARSVNQRKPARRLHEIALTAAVVNVTMNLFTALSVAATRALAARQEIAAYWLDTRPNVWRSTVFNQLHRFELPTRG